MDINDQIELEHILFFERKCRTCNKVKNLLDDFYLIRKNKRYFPSSYSYECKECTKKRIVEKRKKNKNNIISYFILEYPDW